MIYDHIVKFNGKYYNAGVEVPEKEESLSASDDLSLLEEDVTRNNSAALKTKTSGRRGRPKKSE